MDIFYLSNSILRTSIIPVLLTLGPAAGAQDQLIRGTDGEVLGSQRDFHAAMGGQLAWPFGPPTAISAVQRGVYEVRLQNTGTGWEEQLLIGVPAAPQWPAPLLVAFHSYGRTPHEVLNDTTLFQDGMARGWVVVAPLGAHKFHYGVEYAQENIAYGLDWLTGTVDIDFDRIYGVGFSMGGGAVASYAARHLDPTKPMFAGLVNHTGSTSLRHVHAHVPNPQLLEDPGMFGDTPARASFRYARVSTVDMDGSTILVQAGNHMVRNLRNTPTRTWRVLQDPVNYLRVESDIFAERLEVTGGESVLEVGPGNQHTYSTLDETSVFTFLEPLTRRVPGPDEVVRVVADRNARWYQFDLTQRGEGFSQARWYAATGFNRLVVDKLRNVEVLAASVDELELDGAVPLDVVLSTSDGLPITLRLAGYGQSPSSVTRGGTATNAWAWDGNTGVVTIFETDSANYPSWRIVP